MQHWQHLDLISKDEYETDQNFQSFHFLLFTSRCDKQLRMPPLVADNQLLGEQVTE